MGTRALIHIKDDTNDKTLVTIYNQYDGYESSLGKELRDLLANHGLVNGLRRDEILVHNGMGDLAAWLIYQLKKDNLQGNRYIYPTDSKDCGEEYVYIIYPMAAIDYEFKPDRVAREIGIKVYDFHNERVTYEGAIDTYPASEAVMT